MASAFGWGALAASSLALGALMAAERTTHRGRHLTRPLGLILVLAGALCLAGVVTLPTT